MCASLAIALLIIQPAFIFKTNPMSLPPSLPTLLRPFSKFDSPLATKLTSRTSDFRSKPTHYKSSNSTALNHKRLSSTVYPSHPYTPGYHPSEHQLRFSPKSPDIPVTTSSAHLSHAPITSMLRTTLSKPVLPVLPVSQTLTEKKLMQPPSPSPFAGALVLDPMPRKRLDYTELTTIISQPDVQIINAVPAPNPYFRNLPSALENSVEIEKERARAKQRLRQKQYRERLKTRQEREFMQEQLQRIQVHQTQELERQQRAAERKFGQK